MLYVLQDGTIRLTRGDTARFCLSVRYSNDCEEYEIAQDDIVQMTVRKTPNSDEILLHKRIVGTNIFHIEPSDTESLPFGRYVYDVQIENGDGDIYTVIEPSVFELMKEVTRDE